MVYKFTFVSDEVDDFVRVIEINADATFLELHKALLKSVGYAADQISSFFMCSDDWEKEQEVTLFEVESSSEYDNLTMDETRIEDLIEDEKQKVLYVYDVMFERAFFGELTEIISHKDLAEAECVHAGGEAPKQIQDLEDVNIPIKDFTIDEDFYGDSDYSLDELDEDGFADLTFDENNY